MLQNFTKPVFYHDADGAPGSPAAEPKISDNEPMIPKSRFDEINDRAKKAESQLQEYQRQEAERIQKQLEEQGKYKEITEGMKMKLAEAEQKAAKAEQYEKHMESFVTQKMANIPDELKSFVPEGSTESRFNWLNVNYEKLVKPIAPPTGAGRQGAGGDGKTITLTDEEHAMAQKFNMSDEDYFKNK